MCSEKLVDRSCGDEYLPYLYKYVCTTTFQKKKNVLEVLIKIVQVLVQVRVLVWDMGYFTLLKESRFFISKSLDTENLSYIRVESK